jgi:hypothetical protein
VEPARMGLILDSSLIIGSERRGQRVWDILERVEGLKVWKQEDTVCLRFSR